ncbi:hypothetical protein B9T33_00010 [Acinetobacter sp. ANC 5054]|nr:hypothetical protein B9T33_00010 [Acinetobacter sp. ANC 5054]
MTKGIKQRAKRLENMDLSDEVPEIEANPSPHKNPKIGRRNATELPSKITACIVTLNVIH